MIQCAICKRYIERIHKAASQNDKDNERLMYRLYTAHKQDVRYHPARRYAVRDCRIEEVR